MAFYRQAQDNILFAVFPFSLKKKEKSTSVMKQRDVTTNGLLIL
jgi:hypothetical protein